MAKAIVYAKEKVFKYKSQFGSHSDMVDKQATEELNQVGKVVCVDQYGSYITSLNRLDDGLCDWNRADGTRCKVEKEKS